MITALLIDGSESVTGIRIKEEEKFQRLKWSGAATKPAQEYKFVKMVGEGDRAVALYRAVGRELSDELFNDLAAAEADKYLHPEKYTTAALQKRQESDAARRLAEYERRYGPLN